MTCQQTCIAPLESAKEQSSESSAELCVGLYGARALEPWGSSAAKIRRSWFRNNQDTVCGRFDFCLTDTGVKVYEYNADSASALFECGYVQDRWAQAAGLSQAGPRPHSGMNTHAAGVDLFQLLTGSLCSLKEQG